MRSEDTEPPEPSPMDDFLAELDRKPPKVADEPQAPPDLLTVAETARWLRCSPDSVRRWIKKGYLTEYRKGPHPTARYLVSRDDVVRMLGGVYPEVEEEDETEAARSGL